uniref:50S ribosomal protein L19, chloroplastic n=1 Tax=Spumella sp. NIES-1846 TaxID=2490549 RepID=A0A455RF34_9STRA|nr:ribosomal protein L19 [Spumella sp. NIES-1846]
MLYLNILSKKINLNKIKIGDFIQIKYLSETIRKPIISEYKGIILSISKKNIILLKTIQYKTIIYIRLDINNPNIFSIKKLNIIKKFSLKAKLYYLKFLEISELI